MYCKFVISSKYARKSSLNTDRLHAARLPSLPSLRTPTAIWNLELCNMLLQSGKG